jgi:hemolysin activation/secretion protein
MPVFKRHKLALRFALSAGRFGIAAGGPQEMTEKGQMSTLTAVRAAIALLWMMGQARAEQAATSGASTASAADQQPRSFDINEFRVEGSKSLSAREVESAVYPYLGPARVLEDVERARAALEKAYTDKGFQSVSVAIPPQTVRDGVVLLKVTEGTVGRLHVYGARWFSPRDVKRQAPSVAEGSVPNFDDIARDIVILNQIPDRRVTPALRAGVLPGTVDVDLMVQDALPLHGSVEFNNRHGRYTTPLRLSGSLRYDNFWQLGHSLGFSYQLAPRRAADGRVFTASYLARFPRLPWLTLTASYLDQNSDISTVGGINVAGTGQIAGVRAGFTLPGSSTFFHVVNAGFDYKRFGQLIRLEEVASSTPLTTWPITAMYSAIFSHEASETLLTLGLTFNVRSASSPISRFEERRFNSHGDFIYYRGELSRTNKLPFDFQLYGKAQGQYSADPLVSSDQFSAGGAESVRGYYDSEVVGDFGASGTIELRGPSLTRWFGNWANDWRFHLFVDGAWLGIHDPLPEQADRFRLWSTGAGTRLRVFKHLSGELEVSIPMRSEGITRRHETRVHFRLAALF